MQEDRLAATLEEIDRRNAADPNFEEGQPAELLYGQRMTETLDAFAPDAGPLVQIAARGQHLERWTRPRADYPEGKAGYHAWRNDLKAYHATEVAGIMAAQGYPPEDQETVGRMIRKEGIKRDAQVQLLEDVICLTFIKHYFAAFAAKHPQEKVLDIVAKTGRKMSPEGKAAARALGLPSDVDAALG
ncbi:DUF4202 family protein [Rhodobacteraceae bacterium KN286]|uniref:DUF4202 family protein n=2 Tax=Oceanomicrobium pacificus TaxID=2692916 RepID=A0A6B0TZT2_9RHOB|nr:DUF4202 family protein [Oceanomicrobium pacificus]